MTLRHAAKIDCDTIDMINRCTDFFLENNGGVVGQLGCKIWNFRWEFLLYSGLGFALEVMQDDEADEMMYLSCIYHLSKLFGVSLPVFLRIIGQLVALILVWTTYLALANRSLVQALLQNARVRRIGLLCSWQVVVEIWWRAQEISETDFRCSELTLETQGWGVSDLALPGTGFGRGGVSFGGAT